MNLPTISTSPFFTPAIRVLRPSTPFGSLMRLTLLCSVLAGSGCTELHIEQGTSAGEESGDADAGGTAFDAGNEAGAADEGLDGDGDAGDAGDAGPSGDGDGDGDGDSGSDEADTGADEAGDEGPAAEPFDRFVQYEATAEGVTMQLLPGPDMSALIPATETISIYAPFDESSLWVSAVDSNGHERFKVRVEDGVDVLGNGTLGMQIELADHRKMPRPPINCTVPPCPQDILNGGWIVNYDEGGVNWTIGDIDDNPFGHGVSTVDGETRVVPFESGRELRPDVEVQMTIAEALFDDANEFLSLSVDAAPPEMAGFWGKLCKLGRWGLKGTLTVGQAGCCGTPPVNLMTCVACAAVGEAGKDLVDKINCD